MPKFTSHQQQHQNQNHVHASVLIAFFCFGYFGFKCATIGAKIISERDNRTSVRQRHRRQKSLYRPRKRVRFGAADDEEYAEEVEEDGFGENSYNDDDEVIEDDEFEGYY